MLDSVKLCALLSVCLVSADREDVTPATDFESKNAAFLRSCWKQNIIPFSLNAGFSQSEINYIYKMIAVFHNSTCLRWVEYTPLPASRPLGRVDLHLQNSTTIDLSHLVSDEGTTIPDSFVEFFKVYDGRCRTSRVLKENDHFVAHIKLPDSCFRQNAVMHEMMHALGFHHEHQRSDRSCYVSVVREAEHLPNYKIIPHEPWIERYPYDKYSVLHYAKSHLMVSRRQRRKGRPPSDFLGNAKGHLTHLDLSKIMYKFCDGPHYCDISPYDCRVAADWRSRRGCVRTA